MSTDKILLKEYQLNKALRLKNRIIMAPMTRAQASSEMLATEEMAAYYAKRSGAGLIITEGTVIRGDGIGHTNVPGIYKEQQIDAWKKVTAAVHENNGLIFMQLWHVGRVSHPTFLNGGLPISASETTMTGRISRSPGLFHGKARAATVSEIQEIVSAFAKCAQNAIQAGFDGVEIHGANGYLIDQFLHHDTNRRIDSYGGNPENMARFPLEVIQAVGETIGYERVGLRLSPGAYLNEITGNSKDAEVFSYLLNNLNNLSLAYLHTGNFNDSVRFKELNDMTMSEFLRKHFKGKLIASGGYSAESAEEAISSGKFDLVSMGRPFIANYDLIRRLERGEALEPYDVTMLNKLI